MNRTGKMPGSSSGGFVGDPLGAIKHLASGVGGKIRAQFPGGGMLIDILASMGGKLAKGGLDMLKKKFEETVAAIVPGNFGSKPVAGLGGSIRDIATRALQYTGNFNASNLASMLRRINQESGGNPNAINLRDSNAKRGTPSKGLMQVIGPTFGAFRDPRLSSNIYDPMANMVASIRYTLARYGSLRAGWDRPGGYSSGGLVSPRKYDQGGWLQPGVQAVVNKTRRPEPILTQDQWRNINTLAQRGAGDAGDQYYISVPRLAATGEDVADAIQYRQRVNRRK